MQFNSLPRSRVDTSRRVGDTSARNYWRWSANIHMTAAPGSARESRTIRWGIKPRKTSRARTSGLILAANFIFGASRANDSASTVSPQCSRGGPDSDTRSRRKSVKPAQKSALDREHWPGGPGNHVAAVEIGILIGRDKNCGRSRIRVVVETRSSTSTFRFKCRSPVRLSIYTCRVTSGLGPRADQKQTALCTGGWRWHHACHLV